MEEPLDYQSPNQDKVISLIAWLIIASILFYVIVFTFESFLKKSPSVAVNSDMTQKQPVDPSRTSETVEVQDDEPEDSSKLQNPFSDMVRVERPQPSDVAVSGAEAQNTDDFFDGFEAPEDTSSVVAEQEATKSSPAESQEQPVQVSERKADTPSESDPIAEAIEPAVNSAPEPKPQSEPEPTAQTPRRMLRMSREFQTMRAALNFMKNHGRTLPGLEFELTSADGGYQVLLPQKEGPTRDFMLQIMQTEGVRFEGLKATEVRTLEVESRRAMGLPADNSSLEPAEVVQRYRQVALKRPVTIQVGSFLRRDNAVGLRDRMIESGYLSDIEEFWFKGKAQYRVVVGNYGNRKEASQTAAELSEKFEVPVYVREAPVQ